MVTWRSIFGRKHPDEPVDLQPVPLMRAAVCHLGNTFIVRVPEHITTITVPHYSHGDVVEYTYRRTEECIIAGDGLAVLFTNKGDDSDD